MTESSSEPPDPSQYKATPLFSPINPGLLLVIGYSMDSALQPAGMSAAGPIFVSGIDIDG